MVKTIEPKSEPSDETLKVNGSRLLQNELRVMGNVGIVNLASVFATATASSTANAS
jgi:hypothetical protein